MNRQISGELLAFDININLVLDNAKELENGEMKKKIGLTFIRGDSVIYVSPS
jgi:small nuclear ribonucleoprotein (snRNP)-like protein